MIQPDSFPDKVPEPSASELLTEVLRLLKREDCIRLYSRVKAALMIQEWPITPESRAREVRLKQAGLILLGYGFEQGWGSTLAAVDLIQRSLPSKKRVLLEEEAQAVVHRWEQALERLLQQLQTELDGH
ncbi:hypothetical protein [Thermogemmatispora onikobensis]|uniref:hypothetical protein n=1 Tax=Thermogemmatispora onikobensis TaxID=732234 RepID=UPI0008532512|nr:hypothetical protein [Thermogemmatispora onikobensis]